MKKNFKGRNDDLENTNELIINENDNGDDAFIIGKGFSVDEEVVKTDKKKRRRSAKGMNPVLKSIIWILSIIIVSVGLAGGVIYAGADFMGIGFGRGENCVVEVAPGTPASTIAEQLNECGAVKIPILFRLYAKLTGYENQFKYGVYTFNNEAGYESLAEMLVTDGAKAESVTVKIPEMATIDDIAVLLADAGVCTKADFIDVVKNGDFKLDFVKDIPAEKVHYRLEGYLFPDTYDFYCYDSKQCAYLAVEKMLKALENKFDESMLKKIDQGNYSFHEIITMASIIESESANGSAEERAKVAAVFYNRLEGRNWDGPKFLQTDPSTYYPYGNGRYDTYKTEGLPPGPIGSPSLNSIKAALNPQKDFNATYFVTDKNADFYFNETLSGHNKTIADLKKKGLWLYTQLGSR